jgi:RHS repeat-associated protein
VARETLEAGQVPSVDGPVPNDTITYSYEALGRGTFTYGYDGPTGRLATVTYPNGQTSAYSYLPAGQDHRLQTIHRRFPNATTLSRFDYTYDAVGNILTWQQQAGNAAPERWRYGYDRADQLTSALKETTDAVPAVLQRLAYGYDPAGNRVFEQMDDTVTAWSHDALNRLVAQAGGGVLQVVGTVNEPAAFDVAQAVPSASRGTTVTIQGQAATVSSTQAFAGALPVVPGTNVFTIRAVDPSGNAATATYEVDVTDAPKTFTYDANGNLTSDGTRSFEWDARNQLVAVTVGPHRSEFVYDGLQRRVRQVEKDNGVTTADARVVWCETAICEERAADGVTVTRRAFGLGEQVSGQARFFTTDHLGSVREVTDTAGTLLARYAFDPWGRRTVTAGADVTTVGFTGHQWQASTARWQTWYRAYDPELSRWISEDPAGLVDGPNRYAYVRNSPVRLFDPDGRQAQALPIIVICSPDPVTKAALIAAGAAAGAMIIWKACEDGNCFGDGDKDKKRPNTCKRLLELCLENPMQPPHRQQQWGKRKDCGACFRECNAAGGAWPFYKCPIF